MIGGLARRPQTEPQLQECPGCGLLQRVGALAPGHSAHCMRCSTMLRHVSARPLDHIVALSLAAVVLLILMGSNTLMTVQTAGIRHAADLFSGPVELIHRNMAVLAMAVLFVTVAAPSARLAGMIYVLTRSREAAPPLHLRRIYTWAEKLRPWSMIDVFVFGVFVAYVKLGDVVTIGLAAGVCALLGLTFVLVWIDSSLDREALWERLDSHEALDEGSDEPERAIGCETCRLVNLRRGAHQRCRRCGGALHERKPNSIARTWALVIGAAILYVPANYFPVLTVMKLGAGAPSTIMGGIEELLKAGQYPLVVLVLFASVVVPLLKLIGLTFMLVATQTGSGVWLYDRTRLYHVVVFVGRWSMIDIFMESLLGALVVFGTVITIEPGVGAVAFCGVVMLTMFAAETFDPRLMWDAAVPLMPRLRAGVDH
jgi:paraquat-inducible protein A